MKILCDEHVPPKYIRAFEQQAWITVSTVAETEGLSRSASDEELVEFATGDGWVIFTDDDDFYRLDRQYGLLVYDQIENPAPGAVVDAVKNIDEVYESPTDIVETVPDGWV